jgi:DNA-binding beta-propeller fold protein YncE
MNILTTKRLWVLSTLLGLLLTGCSLTIQPGVMGPQGRVLPLVNDAVQEVTLVGEPILFDTALDATADAAGEMFYFTAQGRNGAGLFTVPGHGGDAVALAVGAPFVDPRGLALSVDEQTVYVADAAAGEGGQLFAVTLDDGTAVPLLGSENTAPQGLEVHEADGQELIYFSGRSPADGQPAVMTLDVASGELGVVAQGAPLVEPIGIAISGAGEVYVVDRQGAEHGLASVFRLRNGQIETLAAGFRTGLFPGTALTLDEAALFVSALDQHKESAQVLVIVLANGTQAVANKVIAANSGAGGLHRARNHNIFAWADVQPPRGGKGGVYRVVTPDPEE